MSGRLRACAAARSWLGRVVLSAATVLSFHEAALAEPIRTDNPRSEGSEIALEIGEQRVVSTEGVRSYSEGTPGVVDVRLTRDGRQFVIVGQKPGQTSLLLMLADGRERQIRIAVREPPAAPLRTGTAPTAVVPKDNVRLDLYFVELRSSARTQMGLAWPGSFGGGKLAARFDALDGTLQSATATITDQALPRLDLAQAGGWAKISRHAAVVTANGTEAVFSGGGEVNIPVRGALAAEIRTIQFGSTVRVLPVYDHSTGRIELTLSAEVSDLTEDGGTGAPGRARAQLQTVVNLELGQCLILGGLTARSEGRGTSGLPFLSQIPILGLLFGTQGHRREASENLVLIVPTVVNSVSLPAKERIREALQIYEQYEGKSKGRPLVPLVDGAPRDAGKAP